MSEQNLLKENSKLRLEIAELKSENEKLEHGIQIQREELKRLKRILGKLQGLIKAIDEENA